MMIYDDLIDAMIVFAKQVQDTAQAMQSHEITNGFGKLIMRHVSDFDARVNELRAMSARSAH